VNLNALPIETGKLSAADLDRLLERNVPLTSDEIARLSALRRLQLMPSGCSQQQRFQERIRPDFVDTIPTQPHTLERRIERETDDCSPTASAVFWGLYLSIAVVAAVAAVAALFP
jgi:hypothetical protein